MSETNTYTSIDGRFIMHWSNQEAKVQELEQQNAALCQLLAEYRSILDYAVMKEGYFFGKEDEIEEMAERAKQLLGEQEG